MSEVLHEPVVPKGGIFAAAALALFALASVTTVRLTGVGEARMTLPAAVESRDLRFEDGKGGAVLVYDAKDHELIDTLAPGSNGFIRVPVEWFRDDDFDVTTAGIRTVRENHT